MPEIVNVRVREVRIQDFRAISHLCFALDEITVLVGENNVGKTSVLRALDIAIGSGRADEDDLRIDGTGHRLQTFVVDLLVMPAEGEEFQPLVRDRLEGAIQIPAAGPESFTLRTQATLNTDGSGVTVERRFVQGWSCERDVANALELVPEIPRRIQLDLLGFFSLDARRDLVDEFRSRSSHWSRLVADLGIPDPMRETIEAELVGLGSKIAESSELLATVGATLRGLKGALGAAVQDVKIAPLPRQVGELSRGMDVLVEAPDSAALPMRLQGMGARSLAAALVFRSFAQARLGSSGDAQPVAITAFEEPEAHLHPQAHRAMFEVIGEIPGQKIVSTHSPHVLARAELENIRVLRRHRDTISVSSLSARLQDSDLTPDDVAKLKRFIQREHGEILFSRAVVLYEGETEEGALPFFALNHWGVSAHTHGISLVSCGGAGNFKHFARALDALRIPWLIFVDGDTPGKDGVAAAGTAIRRPLTRTSDEIVMLPDGLDFEEYLVVNGYRESVERAIEAVEGDGYIAHQRTLLNGQRMRRDGIRDYDSPGWEERLAIDLCRAKKTSYGRAIAEDICETGARPPDVDRLLHLLDRILTL
jgi:putative ATP-dependent endonuclease of OLD family